MFEVKVVYDAVINYQNNKIATDAGWILCNLQQK